MEDVKSIRKESRNIQDENFDFAKEYEKIFIENIHRDGADKVLKWLQETDFFTAPASTIFHGNFRGGLVEHCVRTYWRFCKLAEMEYGAEYVHQQAESLAIIALLHDVCKINYYHIKMRNVKINDVWEKQPYYAIEDDLPYGHGEKSVYLLSNFMKLTQEEAMVINWHMGGFDSRIKYNYSTILNKVYEMFPLALLFHMADNGASYFDERRI